MKNWFWFKGDLMISVVLLFMGEGWVWWVLGVYCETRGHLRESVLSLTICVLGVELRSSALAPSAFTH